MSKNKITFGDLPTYTLEIRGVTIEYKPALIGELLEIAKADPDYNIKIASEKTSLSKEDVLMLTTADLKAILSAIMNPDDEKKI